MYSDFKSVGASLRTHTASNQSNLDPFTGQKSQQMMDREEAFRKMHANGDDQFIWDEFFQEDLDRLNDLYGNNYLTF